MSNSQLAVAKFKEGYNCAQSVLYCYAEKTGVSTNLALKMANGFGAGMGRKQEVCGAISGGILAISLKYGRGENDDKQNQTTTYMKVRELMDHFEAKHGTVNCRNLLSGCDLSTAQGQQEFQSNCLIERCYGYVDTVVSIIDEVYASEE